MSEADLLTNRSSGHFLTVDRSGLSKRPGETRYLNSGQSGSKSLDYDARSILTSAEGCGLSTAGVGARGCLAGRGRRWASGKAVVVLFHMSKAMLRSIKTINDVVDWNMCVGCGACVYGCDKAAVSLVNILDEGIRPQVEKSACEHCEDKPCLSVCPGYRVDGEAITGAHPRSSEADREFGPALEIWEGHAVDPTIRHRASSGGLLTALSLYCLENEDFGSVVHAAMDEAKPWLNKTVVSRSREELLSRTGSRYAPASPCEALGAMEDSQHPCVFIGKPCDTTAVDAARRQSAALDSRIGLVLTFFCAGTPSTMGTKHLLDGFEIPLEAVDSVRYRGLGWPGGFRVEHSKDDSARTLNYAQTWGRLSKFRPFRCHVCPDGLGRIADISCGDSWHEYSEGTSDPGRSIVLVRTPLGQSIVQRAIEANYVELRPYSPENVLQAQKFLLKKRRQIFGRLSALRLVGIPTPRFKGFDLFSAWTAQPVKRQVRDVLGTLRRLRRYGFSLTSRPSRNW